MLSLVASEASLVGLITSPCLKFVIGLGVRLRVPFLERAKRIVRFAAATGFRKDHPLIVDFVNQVIAWLKAQGGAHWLGNGGLRLGCKFAGDHIGLDSSTRRNFLA